MKNFEEFSNKKTNESSNPPSNPYEWEEKFDNWPNYIQDILRNLDLMQKVIVF